MLSIESWEWVGFSEGILDTGHWTGQLSHNCNAGRKGSSYINLYSQFYPSIPCNIKLAESYLTSQ